MMPSVPQPKAPVTQVAQASTAVARPQQPRSAATLLNFIRNHAPRPLAEIMMDPAPVTGIAMSSSAAIGGGGIADGVISGLGDPATHTPPPPPPPVQQQQPVERKAPQIMRVGGDVLAAKIVRRVLPVYPPLAKQARVSGTVRLMGKIASDGSIQQLEVLSGHPLLVKAAVDAVRQWLYKPTLLNGEPVEVQAPIEVNFTLAQ
jgi:protein TonB